MKLYKPFFYLWVLAVFHFALPASAQSSKPNIVVVIADDHTMQAIGAYGSPYGVTPNIDKLAKEGIVFNNAFVSNSICGPSRAVFLTGKYSHINGFTDNHSKFNGSQNQFQKNLQIAGYQTAWIGKWHLETTPQGFDFWKILPGQGEYYNPDFLTMDEGRKKVEGYVTDIITDYATDWLDQRDKSKPFCLIVGQKATHRTWMPDIKDLGATDHLKIELPNTFFDDYEGRQAAKDQDMSIEKTMKMGYDLKMFDDSLEAIKEGGIKRMNPEQRKHFLDYYKKIKEDLDAQHLSGKALVEWKYQRYMKDYLATSMSLDRNVGRLMDYLRKNGLMENTMVIYTSDQGFYLGEHGWFDKRFMYEESMRTPMIMRYSNLIKKSATNDDLIMNLDFAPTFLQLAGLLVPSDIQGQSLLPLLKGDVKEKDWRKSVYYHYYEHPGEHNVYKHFGVRTSRYKLIRFYAAKNFWELYDLKNDPNEMHNLYGKKEYKAKIVELKKELRKLINQYNDTEANAVLNEEEKGEHKF